jgi:hypothetical protein
MREALLFRGLPQFNAIAFRINNPSETAVVVTFLVSDLHAFLFQGSEQSVYIVNSVID